MSYSYTAPHRNVSASRPDYMMHPRTKRHLRQGLDMTQKPVVAIPQLYADSPLTRMSPSLLWFHIASIVAAILLDALVVVIIARVIIVIIIIAVITERLGY